MAEDKGLDQIFKKHRGSFVPYPNFRTLEEDLLLWREDMNAGDPVVIRKVQNGYIITKREDTVANAETLVFNKLSDLTAWVCNHFESKEENEGDGNKTEGTVG